MQVPFRSVIIFYAFCATHEKITIRWIALSTFRTTGPWTIDDFPKTNKMADNSLKIKVIDLKELKAKPIHETRTKAPNFGLKREYDVAYKKELYARTIID